MRRLTLTADHKGAVFDVPSELQEKFVALSEDKNRGPPRSPFQCARSFQSWWFGPSRRAVAVAAGMAVAAVVGADFPPGAVDVVVSTVAGAGAAAGVDGSAEGRSRPRPLLSSRRSSAASRILLLIHHSYKPPRASRSSSTSSSCRCSRKSRPGSCRTSA